GRRRRSARAVSPGCGGGARGPPSRPCRRHGCARTAPSGRRGRTPCGRRRRRRPRVAPASGKHTSLVDWDERAARAIERYHGGEDGTGAARWALDAGAADAGSPVGRYAATLALLVLGRDPEARVVAETLTDRDDFPRDVAEALLMIAGLDRVEYAIAVEDVLE